MSTKIIYSDVTENNYWYDSTATNRLITAKDHASVQINVGDVDEKGHYTGNFKRIELCGFIRSSGESDDSLNRLATEHGCK